MFKTRGMVTVAMLAGSAMWAIAALTPEDSPRDVVTAQASQIDTFGLMSASRHLPAQAYEAY